MILDPASFATQPLVFNASTRGRPVVGQPALGFTLKTIDGGEVTLSSLQSQPIFVSFWANWCAPCRAEMAGIVRTYESYKADGLVVLAINLTFHDSLAQVQAFATEFNMTTPVLLDETGAVARDRYFLRGLPMSFFVDRNGVIVRHIGAMRSGQIDVFVSEIVRQ